MTDPPATNCLPRGAGALADESEGCAGRQEPGQRGSLSPEAGRRHSGIPYASLLRMFWGKKNKTGIFLISSCSTRTRTGQWIFAFHTTGRSPGLDFDYKREGPRNFSGPFASAQAGVMQGDVQPASFVVVSPELRQGSESASLP